MTPDQLSKSGTEHGHQRALFAFCNMAMRVGFEAAFEWNETGVVPKFDIEAPLSIPCLEWFHAIHNQGHGDAIRGGMAKAEGVKKGVADTFLPMPLLVTLHNRPRLQGTFGEVVLKNNVICGLYIEMKKPSEKAKKSGYELKGASEEQLEFRKHALSSGYAWKICYNWKEAAQLLQSYIEQ